MEYIDIGQYGSKRYCRKFVVFNIKLNQVLFNFLAEEDSIDNSGYVN